ncbi:MAG: cohesin domain-containing protein [Anaerolineales bacterium]
MRNKVRLICGTIIFCLLLQLSPGASMADPDITVRVDTPSEVEVDSEFSAVMNITEVADLDGFQVDVSYDPTILGVIGVSDGEIGGAVIPIDMWGEITPGRVRVIGNVPGVSGVNGSGYLAVVHFYVVGSPGDASEIDLSDGILGDKYAQEMTPVSWIGSSLVVSGDSTPTTYMDAGVECVAPVGDDGYMARFTYTWLDGGTGPLTLERSEMSLPEDTWEGEVPEVLEAGEHTFDIWVRTLDDLTWTLEAEGHVAQAHARADDEKKCLGVPQYIGGVFYDVEPDGMQGAHDLPLGNWMVELRGEETGEIHTTETVSDTVSPFYGQWAMPKEVVSGTYVVSNVGVEGWVQSYPTEPITYGIEYHGGTDFDLLSPEPEGYTGRLDFGTYPVLAEETWTYWYPLVFHGH